MEFLHFKIIHAVEVWTMSEALHWHNAAVAQEQFVVYSQVSGAYPTSWDGGAFRDGRKMIQFWSNRQGFSAHYPVRVTERGLNSFPCYAHFSRSGRIRSARLIRKRFAELARCNA
jgi:hypothetical protein